MPSPLAVALTFLKTNDLKSILTKLNSRDTHPFIQFLKYSISGGVATVVFSVIFGYLRHRFPAPVQAAASGVDWEPLPYVFTAFMFSNATVYWLNTRWVFTPGRHSVVREFLFFTLVNMPGAVGGYFVLQWMSKAEYGIVAQLIGFLIPNILINFVCRKFFIFQK